MTDSVFVSYSRDDSKMATMVVQLLRAQDNVFYDIDSIPAGERWRDALLRAIDNASHFYLLWCIHSAASQEVESEYERAISGNKRLVPVLLDSTPLINPLTEYQWVDFRGFVEGHEAAETPPPASASPWNADDVLAHRPPPGPPKPGDLVLVPEPPDLESEPEPPAYAPRRPLAVVALLIIIVAALLVFMLRSDFSVAPSVWRGVLLALAVIAVLAGLGTFIAWITKRRSLPSMPPPPPSEYRPNEYQVSRAAVLLADAIALDLAKYGSSRADSE